VIENPTFPPVVHRDSRQQMVKIRSPWAFPNSFNLSEPFPFGIFVKSFFNKILVEQGKVQLLLKKPCHFSEKNYSKIRNTLWISEIFFFTILNSCSTDVHTQK
jgi:hypothetical protein